MQKSPETNLDRTKKSLNQEKQKKLKEHNQEKDQMGPK